jgi:hypothetical protein
MSPSRSLAAAVLLFGAVALAQEAFSPWDPIRTPADQERADRYYRDMAKTNEEAAAGADKAWAAGTLDPMVTPRVWSWTDSSGRPTGKQGVIGGLEITVEIKVSAGTASNPSATKSYKVALQKLSPGDRNYLRRWIANGLSKAAAKQAPQTRQVAPWTRDRSTAELRRDAVGMAKDDLILWLGPPNRTADLGIAGTGKSFFYDRIARDPDSGKTVDAMITVENERVTRVSFQ